MQGADMSEFKRYCGDINIKARKPNINNVRKTYTITNPLPGIA